MKKRKVGIMGGTFDPIHLGHLLAGECAREGAGLDEVWFVPVFLPPHKEQTPGADSRQRWEMVCLAVEGNPYFRPIDVEIAKGGKSYSIETVQILQQRYPDLLFSYIIGADMVQYLPNWHRIDELVRRIGFIGLKRPGTEIRWDLLPEHIRSCVTIVDMPSVDISSTVIRERLKTGHSVRYMVPDKVRLYIEEEKLYG